MRDAPESASHPQIFCFWTCPTLDTILKLMSRVARSLHQALRALLFTGTLALALVSGAAPGAPDAALADEDAPVKAGTTLVAGSDVELQKVVIARGSRVEVTAATTSDANIALPDGYVLKHVPMNRIRYFFDVVR